MYEKPLSGIERTVPLETQELNSRSPRLSSTSGPCLGTRDKGGQDAELPLEPFTSVTTDQGR